MDFVFWEDKYSKALKKKKFFAIAFAWKLMNFSGKIWMVILAANFFLFCLAFLSIKLGDVELGMLGTLSQAILALVWFLFFVAGFFMMLYGFCGAYLALRCREYLWFIIILAFGMLAFVYRRYKIAELEKGTFRIK